MTNTYWIKLLKYTNGMYLLRHLFKFSFKKKLSKQEKIPNSRFPG